MDSNESILKKFIQTVEESAAEVEGESNAFDVDDELTARLLDLLEGE